MKKISTVLAAIILILTATSCGNDEPKDQVWVMNTQLINHVVNSVSGEFVNMSMGGIYVEYNVTKMTANLAYAVAIGNDNVTIELTDVAMTYDKNAGGYLIQLKSPVSANNHSVNDLDIFIDMHLDRETLCHWVSANIDGKYEINALAPVISFLNSSTHITEPNGDTASDNKGTYEFSFVGLSTENKFGSLSISGIDFSPFDYGLKYGGLDVEFTNEGLHITNSKTLYPAEGTGQYQLTNLDATINFASHSFSAEVDVENTAKLNATGAFAN